MISPLMGLLIVIPFIDLVLHFLKDPLKNWRNVMVFLFFPVLFFSFGLYAIIKLMEISFYSKKRRILKVWTCTSSFSYVKLLSIYGVNQNVVDNGLTGSGMILRRIMTSRKIIVMSLFLVFPRN